jgi:hypothetical protein
MDKMIDLYFDIDGRCIPSEDFLARYPNRVMGAEFEAGLLKVTTEFVGVNHNPDPDGSPWIFETLVVDRETGRIVLSRWASSQAESLAAHVKICRFVRFGGALLYRAVRFARGLRLML